MASVTVKHQVVQLNSAVTFSRNLRLLKKKKEKKPALQIKCSNYHTAHINGKDTVESKAQALVSLVVWLGESLQLFSHLPKVGNPTDCEVHFLGLKTS